MSIDTSYCKSDLEDNGTLLSSSSNSMRRDEGRCIDSAEGGAIITIPNLTKDAEIINSDQRFKATQNRWLDE